MVDDLTKIGEFGLIRRLRDLLVKEGSPGRGLLVGIGDDTASFVPRPKHEILVTCDSMVEGKHYLPDRMTPHELGRRAMTLNISDIGAMGGSPLYALVSLGLKPETSSADVEEIYRGFLFELNPFNAAIVGGNITGAGDRAFIDITLLGEVPEGRAVHRSTARVGDSVLITGFPGRAAAGLQMLLRLEGKKNLKDHPLVQKYFLPGHRAIPGRAVGDSGFATAMIDTSDGLLGDLGHICEESGTGAELYQEKLPVDGALLEASRELGQDPYGFVLGESDDYELIITCSPAHRQGLVSVLRESGVESVAEIGKITPAGQGIRLIYADGGVHSLKPKGWDHFERSEQ